LQKAMDIGLMVLGLVLDYAVYLVAVYVLYKAARRFYAYFMTLWVQGDLNEWVILTRNGKLVQAGIGLSRFRSPFDSVAVFPSRLTKVEIYTQQVTQEMQGVQVSSMIEWTVDKNGQGPMKAYQNLNLGNGFQ